MADYKVREGESLYDIAAVLYEDTPGGMADLLALNPGVSLLSPSGTLTYTQGLKRKIQRIAVPMQTPTPLYATLEGQTHYDLAIQVYGSIAGLGKVMQKLPTLDEIVVPGTLLEYTKENTKEAEFFRRVTVATHPGSDAVGTPDPDHRLLEDGFDRLLETGELRLLE